MRQIPKNMIGFSGKYFVQAMLIREGFPCTAGKDGIDLVVSLKRPRREYSFFVVSNLQPKRAGGKGKEALDWWIPAKTEADIIACVDLSALRVWLFERDELAKYAQQKTASKYHLYMYTEKGVALRGKKSMKFDYEFEPFRLENRAHGGMFEKRPKRAATKTAPKTRPKRGGKGASRRRIVRGSALKRTASRRPARARKKRRPR
jgi:hypothetical protein